MRRLLLILFTAATLVACTQDIEISYPGQSDDAAELSLNVGFEDCDTRIQFDNELKSVWNKGDILSVFYKSEERQPWRFNGNTGDRTGTISPIGGVSKVPTINGNIVVLYPDNTNYTYSLSDNTVKATITANQQYKAGSYGAGGNILVAQSTNSNISLKNVYGWLRIDLMGKAQSVRTITLVGNNGEQLVGDIVINADDATATFATSGEVIRRVELSCDDSVALAPGVATSFYIGLIPQIFENGITIEIENSKGEKMIKSTSKRVAISRRAIQPMAAFEFVPEPNESFYPGNNQVWYNTEGGQMHTFTVISPFNASINNHEFGVCIEEQCYSLYNIDFNAEVTAVNQAAFYSSDLQIIYLPHSIKTVGLSSFLSSPNLKSVHIGNDIERIETGAFANCGNLEALYIRSALPPTLGSHALERDSTGPYVYIGSTIYVPQCAVELYKRHPSWRIYADYIRSYDFTLGREPEIGEGEDSSSTSPFNHRLLIVDHTGVNCGYCPEAIDRLTALANSEFSDYYNEVSVHGGGYAPSSIDPAYSYAASVVDDFYNPNGYPALYLNYKDTYINRGSSNDTFVNTTMSNLFNTYRKKWGADVGIAITTSAQSGTLKVDIDVKSAKEQRYYVAVWVLENNISNPNQNGATKPIHKVANHALRYIATEYDSQYMSGNSLGLLAVGSVAERSYTIPIDSNWVADNLEVLVIVSANDQVVNTALCPANATKDYEYITDVNSGTNDSTESSDDTTDDDTTGDTTIPADECAVGSLYNKNGVKGIVYAIEDFPVYNEDFTEVVGYEKYCYIFSLDEEDLQWSTKYESCNCMAKRGDYNTYDPFDRWGRDINNYPAFKWCMSHGEGWFMPSSTELNWMWDAITDGQRDFSAPSVAKYNKLITDNGGEPFCETYYWSSNETSEDLVEVVAFINSSVVCLTPKKDDIFSTRAVYRFRIE